MGGQRAFVFETGTGFIPTEIISHNYHIPKEPANPSQSLSKGQGITHAALQGHITDWSPGFALGLGWLPPLNH